MNWNQLLHDYGWPTAVLVIALVTGMREMWYFGGPVRTARDLANQNYEKAIDRAMTRGNEYRDLALSLLQQNRESLTIGQQIAAAIKGSKEEG